MLFSKNIMSTSPFVFALLVSRLRTLQKDAYCFGYNYRNRPAMGDIFSIEKALLVASDNHPEISSRVTGAADQMNA
jgi:hypothetical protein